MISCLSDYLHVLKSGEDDGEYGGQDPDQVDQVHLVRDKLPLVRADKQAQEISVYLYITKLFDWRSLDDKEGSGNVVDDVENDKHVFLLTARLNEEYSWRDSNQTPASTVSIF